MDDFSNPATGWPVTDERYVSAGYDNGEYVVRTRRLGYVYLFAAPTCSREQYFVDVDVRWVGDPGNSYGIIFGIKGNFEQYYLLEVNSELKQYRLLYRGPGGWSQLLPPLQTNSINSGGASNHLAVRRFDDSVRFVINGTTLYSWSDPNLSGSTRAGIMSWPDSHTLWSEARFDNFSITTPPWLLPDNGQDAGGSSVRLGQPVGGRQVNMPAPPPWAAP
jgi:hypothetical protein